LLYKECNISLIETKDDSKLRILRGQKKVINMGCMEKILNHKIICLLCLILFPVIAFCQKKTNLEIIDSAQSSYFKTKRDYKLCKQLQLNRNACSILRQLVDKNDSIYMMEGPGLGGMIIYKDYKSAPYYCNISTGESVSLGIEKEVGDVGDQRFKVAKADSDFEECYLELVKGLDKEIIEKIGNHGRCLDCTDVILTKLVNGRVEVCKMDHIMCNQVWNYILRK